MARPGFGQRLRDYLEGEELEAAIEKFLNRHAKTVKRTSSIQEARKLTLAGDVEVEVDSRVVSTGEYELEVHDIWQQYLKMIEDSMDELRKGEDLSPMEFKSAIEDLPKSQSILIRMMIASWEFQQFVELCVDHSDYMDEQKATEEGVESTSYLESMDEFYAAGKSTGEYRSNAKSGSKNDSKFDEK